MKRNYIFYSVQKKISSLLIYSIVKLNVHESHKEKFYVL